MLGILGALIGRWLADLINFKIGFGIFGDIVIAFAGAVMLLLLWRLLFRRHKH